MLTLACINFEYLFVLVHLLLLLHLFPYVTFQNLLKSSENINPLMPGGNKKVTHTYTNLQLNAAFSCRFV